MKKTIIISAIFLVSYTAYSQLELIDGTDLYVVPGSSLYITSDINSDNAVIWNFGTIDLKGKLVNNTGGLIEASSTGTFIFGGTTTQEISGNHDVEFYGTTEIDNLSGVALTNSQTGADQTINGELKFTNGKLTLNEFNLMLGTVDPTGFSADKYVLTNNTGMLKRNVPADGSSTVNFPVGNSSYNPVSLRNNLTASTDTYGVRVEDEEPAGSSTPEFVDRNWIIAEEEPEGSGLTIIPQWNSGEEIFPFNRNSCAVGRLVTDDVPIYDWKAFDAALGNDPYYREGNEFTEVGVFTVRGNLPPLAICQDVSVSAVENCEAIVSAEDVDFGSSDPDGDPITLDLDPPGPYFLGNTTVTLSVTDHLGASDECTATISVIDDIPPVITPKPVAIEFMIWPPNHKYVTFVLSDFVLSVGDNCASLTVEDVNIVKSISDEPENAEGEGDGNTLDDMVIADDCKSIQLRKERDEDGNGRVYTIYLELNDDYGNTGSATCQIQVPVNNNGTAIDDGTVYEVLGDCDNKSSLIAAIDNEDTDLLVYPNPFSVNATIIFTTTDGPALVKVYNSMGIEVETLFDAHAEAGHEYRLTFNGLAHAPGIYLIHLQSADANIVRKVILNK